MADYVGAIDQGTTSTRFMVFNRSGQTVASAQKEQIGFAPAFPPKPRGVFDRDRGVPVLVDPRDLQRQAQKARQPSRQFGRAQSVRQKHRVEWLERLFAQ